MSARKTMIGACSMGLALGVAGPLVAELISAEADGTRRINLASRQSVLVEEITKAACFAAHGMKAPEHLAELAEAAETYEATEIALRYGDKAMGLLPEGLPSVQGAIGRSEVAWKPFYAAAKRILEADGHDEEDLLYLDDHGDEVLQATDAAAAAIEHEYSKRHVPLNVAVGITIAGRQRVLVERMAKEACMIAHGVHVEQHLGELGESVEMFSLAHDALTNGMEAVGIHAPQGQALKDKLAEASALWAELQPDYMHIVKDGVVTVADLELIDKDTEPLVHILDEIVFLYEQEGPAGPTTN